MLCLVWIVLMSISVHKIQSNHVFTREIQQHTSLDVLIIWFIIPQIKLKIKPRKCWVILCHSSVQTDPEKTKCVAAWNIPINLNDLCKFLGFALYYRQFVKNCAHFAVPLQRLPEKGNYGPRNVNEPLSCSKPI